MKLGAPGHVKRGENIGKGKKSAICIPMQRKKSHKKVRDPPPTHLMGQAELGKGLNAAQPPGSVR